MEVHFLFLNPFFHLFYFGHLRSAVAQQSYKYEKLFTDEKLPYSFAVFLDMSLSQCIATCSQNDTCMGFTYNQMSTQCDLSEYYPPFAGDLVESQTGSNVYFTEDLQCSLSFAYTTHMASESFNTITSQNYPGYYPHNLDEYWLIVKPTRASTLEITFEPIDTELSDDCAYDSINFYNGFCTSEESMFNKVCGTAPSYTFNAYNALYVLVHFQTDDTNEWDINHGGFSMKFRII